MKALAATLSGIHCEVFSKGWGALAMAEMLAVPGTFAIIHNVQCTIHNENELSIVNCELCIPAGFIIIRVAAEQADLITLAVRGACRRQGIAEKLLRQAMARAARMGAEKLFLEVAEGNMAARKLYEKCGFSEVSRRKAYYDDRDDALMMSCALTPEPASLS